MISTGFQFIEVRNFPHLPGYVLYPQICKEFFALLSGFLNLWKFGKFSLFRLFDRSVDDKLKIFYINLGVKFYAHITEQQKSEDRCNSPDKAKRLQLLMRVIFRNQKF